MSTSRLPLTLYSAEQVRELDRLAIEEHDIAAFTLMHRAAQAAFHVLKQQWPQASTLLIVCGTGNNGGDGYLLACLAHAEGMKVSLIQAGNKNRLSDDAVMAWQQWQHCGGHTVQRENFQDAIKEADVIIDALLGTGLQRQVSGDWADLIIHINQAHKPVLSVDIPSGLDADTGAVMGAAIHAHVTVTFIGQKAGLFTGHGPDYCGQVFFDDLGVPAEIYNKVKSGKRVLDAAMLAATLPRRQPGCHKGQCGHMLVIGGDAGMAGAVRMAAEAAGRAGAGLVTVATRPQHAMYITSARPELMCYGVESARDLVPLLQRASVVAIGPGLGQSTWARELLAEVLQTQLYLVLDADALNLLAHKPHKRGRWILTPHPGEAARLLGWSIQQVQDDRFNAVKAISEQYNCVAVLKGAGSLVQAAHEDAAYLCRAGNPGMATAGMGDVLTGVIAGLLAQGLSLSDAARSGVLVHAAAADLAAQQGQRGMLATDLLPCIRRLVNPYDQE